MNVVLFSANEALQARYVADLAEELGKPHITLIGWSPAEETLPVATHIVVSRQHPSAEVPPTPGPVDSFDGAATPDSPSVADGDVVRRHVQRVRRLTRETSHQLRRSAVVRPMRKVLVGGTSRRFAQAALRSDAVTNACMAADVIAALDSASIFVAWKFARRTSRPDVVYGSTAAVQAVVTRSKENV